MPDGAYREVNGVRLWVDVAGAGNPETIIALHGAPGLSTHAEPKGAFGLLADSWQVVTYDARGSGVSDATPPYTHEQWVADLDALREQLGIERFVIAGGSYGGYIALEYAIRHPERVSRIVLRDTAARDYSEFAKANARERAREFPQITDEVLDHVFAGTMRDNDHYRECFATIAPLYDVNHDPVATAERIKGIPFNYETKNFAFAVNKPAYDVREQLKALDIPTLITVGRHDWITPVAASEELHSLLPDSELVIFERSGHSPQKEQKEEWLQAVRGFLDRTASTPE